MSATGFSRLLLESLLLQLSHYATFGKLGMSSRSQETINNYTNWLKPFIKWLEDKSSSGYLHITSQMLTEYLDDRYARG